MSRKHMQQLSEEQLEAVTTLGNILVIATPGSGKTRTLINKVLYDFNEDEARISVAITYTKRAALEMQERIEQQLGHLPNNIWIGTIHSFCLEFIIKDYGSYSEIFSRPFRIIGDSDSEKFKDHFKKKYGLSEYTKINYTLSSEGNPLEEEYSQVVIDYYEALLNKKMIDFNYILYESINMISNNLIIPKQLGRKIRLVCIDEYQDTQELQYQIISRITRDSDTNVFIVGDPNQAIYTGLGGVVKTKDELEKMFCREFTELTLTKCYRSMQGIIEFYKEFCVYNVKINSVIKNDDSDIKVCIDKTKDEVFEAIKVDIETLLEEGYKAKDICVISPQWYLNLDFSNYIRRELPNIEYDAPAIVPLKKDEDNIIYKISTLLISKFSYNNLSFLKKVAYDIIKQFDEEYGINVGNDPELILNIINESKTSDDVGTEFLRKSLANIIVSLKLPSCFEKYVDEFINSTVERIDKYNEQGLEDSRQFFEKGSRSKEGLVISTIHGVKGEEYPVVIAFGLLKGYVPHWEEIINAPKTSKLSSKKLLYVLTSRAKKKIFLYAENSRVTSNGNKYKVNEELMHSLRKCGNNLFK